MATALNLWHRMLWRMCMRLMRDHAYIELSAHSTRGIALVVLPTTCATVITPDNAAELERILRRFGSELRDFAKRYHSVSARRGDKDGHMDGLPKP